MCCVLKDSNASKVTTRYVFLEPQSVHGEYMDRLGRFQAFQLYCRGFNTYQNDSPIPVPYSFLRLDS